MIDKTTATKTCCVFLDNIAIIENSSTCSYELSYQNTKYIKWN